jgi:hypothetical protein
MKAKIYSASVIFFNFLLLAYLLDPSFRDGVAIPLIEIHGLDMHYLSFLACIVYLLFLSILDFDNIDFANQKTPVNKLFITIFTAFVFSTFFALLMSWEDMLRYNIWTITHNYSSLLNLLVSIELFFMLKKFIQVG